MNPIPNSGQRTSSDLLARVQMRDEQAWHRLVDLYGPLVYSWCRRASLSFEDGADVTQEVFRSVAAAVKTFRKSEPGDTFRGWLYTIAQHKIRDHFRHRDIGAEAAGGTAALQFLQQVPGQCESPVDSSDGRAIGGLLRRAVDLVRGDFNDQTWQAFCEGVLKGRATADVAAELGVNANVVRKAKARVLQRLREELGGWEDFRPSVG